MLAGQAVRLHSLFVAGELLETEKSAANPHG
jgi:hypothetical protein